MVVVVAAPPGAPARTLTAILSPLRGDDGEIAGVLITAHELGPAEAALRASEEKHRLLDVTHPDDRKAGGDAMAALALAGGAHRFEKRYLARDGSTIWVDVNVAAVRDVSARKQAEAQLLQLSNRLALAVRAGSHSLCPEFLDRYHPDTDEPAAG